MTKGGYPEQPPKKRSWLSRLFHRKEPDGILIHIIQQNREQRLPKDNYYYYVDSLGEVRYTREAYVSIDNWHWEVGNYFTNEKIAEKVAKAIRDLYMGVATQRDFKIEIEIHR
jgi:hypothetical protein